MADVAIRTEPLPVGSIGPKAFGWWGMVTIIMTEGALFAYLLFGYYYFDVQYGREWLPSELPEFGFSVPNTIIVLLAGASVWWAERSARRGRRLRVPLAIAVGLILGIAFIVIQLIEWRHKPFALFSSSFSSIYFVVSGFHLAHVVTGALILVALLIWSTLGYFDRERHAPLSIAMLYWFFIDAVWLAIFFTFYITPYLG